MTKMLVKKGCVVFRDGKRVRPQIGKTFSFSDDEIEQVNTATPGTLAPASEATAQDGDDTATVSATSNAEAAQAGAKGGKKKATANKADGETDADSKKGARKAEGDDDL